MFVAGGEFGGEPISCKACDGPIWRNHVHINFRPGMNQHRSGVYHRECVSPVLKLKMADDGLSRRG